MINNEKAPIKFYGINPDAQIRVNFESSPTPRINFAEEIQIRLPSKEK